MTTTTTVVNLRDNPTGPDVVRIDRQTMWGNPFRVSPTLTQEDAIDTYRNWLMCRPDLLGAVPMLRGKRLACWCSPLACHGDVLAGLLARFTDAELFAFAIDDSVSYPKLFGDRRQRELSGLFGDQP